jgi:energy-coupling factor transporter ATP-binding protein EcfA2
VRLRTVRLRKFKRFDDLTIDLGAKPAKLVALVGPNGCGKSSVFDAFEQILQNYIGSNSNPEPWFLSKTWYDAVAPLQSFDKHASIQLATEDGTTTFDTKSFYVRTAYRFTPSLRVQAIQDKGDPLKDSSRPGSSTGLDQRLVHNYERLLGRLLTEFWHGSKTGDTVRKELIDRLNARLQNVLDVSISDLGDVTQGKGQLYFSKGTSKNFPFEALSAGEKEVVDMLIDLEVKTPIFNDTVYCIDEPELHLNTAIQRKLLTELTNLIPDTCQLWVATHSIGFLRAVQDDLADKANILDFSERDYFADVQTMKPIDRTRANWKRIFSTALEDLTGLLSPQNLVYCEGRPDPTPSGDEQGLDAIVYNEAFELAHEDTVFISSGGGGASTKHSELALKIIGKAFDSVKLVLLKDRDTLSDTDRLAFLAASSSHRMLKRREVENYLFDFDVLQNYGNAKGVKVEKALYDAIVTDILSDDLKVGQTLQKLAQLCGHHGKVALLKKELGKFLPGTPACQELHDCIFPI